MGAVPARLSLSPFFFCVRGNQPLTAFLLELGARAILDKHCLESVGQLVTVVPIYGMGWSGDQPPDFELRIEEFVCDVDGSARGGHGVIESPSHRYDGCAAIFSVRHEGVWDFEKRIGHFNVCIYDALPADWAAIVLNFRPSKLTRTYKTCGPAMIGFKRI